MTFLELKTEAAGRLNLTSTEALTRLGSYVNQRYRRLTSSLGINTSRRTTVSNTTTNGVDNLTFTLEKLEMVYILATGKKRIVRWWPYEEFRIRSVEQAKSGTPTNYAIKTITPTSVVIYLYPTPDAAVLMYADGMVAASTLVDASIPNISVDFHDALVLGAMSDELFKMEKYELAKDFQKQYEDRVSDFRLYLAKSSLQSDGVTDTPGGLVTVQRLKWQG